MAGVSRRDFLLATFGVTGAMLAPGKLFAFGQDSVLDIPKTGKANGYEKVLWKVQPFPMTEVRLRSGPFQDALEANRKFLLMVPNNRLLHSFRLTAGLPSTATPLGGWEAPDCELRGHFAGGHYLSACALMYSSSGDEELRTKGDALVTELAKCQKENGYLGAYPENFYDRLRKGEKVWAPFYTYHKIMAGHLDMYVHCGNTQSLQTTEKMADWAIAWVDSLSDEQLAQVQKVEHGGMNEVLFNLYAVTGNEKYLKGGLRFEHKAFFEPLAAHEDKLGGLHANTNIPKVIGAARGYVLTGDDRYHSIADYFWHEVLDAHSYCTGGTSNGEMWQAPHKQASELGPDAQECCCSYNMMKLTRHIFGWTADAAAMDYYERQLYNVRLGTQDKDGMLMYYVPLKPGMWKTFGNPYEAFWCCTGTGAEEYAKSTDSIYFHDDQSLYVNLFIASDLNWAEKGIKVTQDTNFPQEEKTTLTIRTEKPTELALKVRVPYWAKRGVTVKINGKRQEIAARSSSYLEIRRKWEGSEKVEIDLPMDRHVAPLSDDPTIQAAMYGPLVLAAQLGKEGLTKSLIYGDSGPDEKKLSGLPMPQVQVKGESLWFERVGGKELKFRTVGEKQPIALKPLYQIFDERYSVYLKIDKQNA